MRDSADVLAVARAHLTRIEATGDSSLTLDPQVAADIELLHAYTVTEDGAVNLDALYVHGWLRWHRYVADPHTSDGVVGYLAALLDLTYCFVVGMRPLPDPMLAEIACRAREAEDELRGRAERFSESARAAGDRQRINAAIGLWRRMIAPDDPVHPEDLPMSWSNLAVLLAARYELDGSAADLDEAVDTLRLALDLEPPGTPERARYQSNLSAALYQRALISAASEDRDEALALGRVSSELSGSNDADRVKHLSNFGISLLRGYEESGSDAELSAAISAFEDARCACSPNDPDLAGVLSNLGNALLRRSEASGSAADLEAAVRAHRRAVSATTAGEPSRAKRLSNLSAALRASSIRLARGDDLDEAIETASEALALLGPGSPDRLGILYTLGGALQARFMRAGALEDLDEGIRLLHEAASEASSTHADYALFAGNLGALLMVRYEWTGAVTDLNAAIQMGRAALNAAAAGYVHRPALLSFLGAALSDRAILPELSPDLSRKDLLDQAVASGEEALAATPPSHHERTRYLTALAASLHDRAELTGSEADLNEAIKRAEEAEHVVQPGQAAHGDGHDAERAGRLANLASFLRDRARSTGSSADLDRALVMNYLALNVVPLGHHTQAMLLMNTGHCLRDQFSRSGDRKALALARNMYILAARTETAMPTVRIHALQEAASLTAMPLDRSSISARKRIRDTAALLESAVMLLPEVAPPPACPQRPAAPHCLVRRAGFGRRCVRARR